VAESPAEVQGRIFISYRRDDAAYPAGWLFDRLAERFGKEQIFKDVDSIELGEDFVAEIGEAVGSTDVLLAVIGEKWLTVADEHGSRRLDDPEDFVRIEIEAALRRKVRVIPILVEGASMPREEQLPPSLTALARRQALELSPARFSSDTSKLLTVLERALADARTAEARAAEERERAKAAVPKPPPTPRPPRGGASRQRLLIGAVAAAVLLALVIGGVVLLTGSGEDTPPDGTPPTPTEPQALPPPGVNGRIAFLSDRELWSARPNGKDRRELTEDWAEVRRPDWSPDGTKIVFASNRGNAAADFDLWIYDTADGTITPLTSGPEDDGAPDWSPDGTEIAFGRGDPDHKDIWSVDVASREVRQVTDDPADDDAPDWSKTNRIAFESDRDRHDYEIFTLDPTGTETDVQQVTDNDWHDLFPDWSFDGRLIAYRSNPGGEDSDADIYAIEIARGRLTRVTNNAEDDHRPSWSPDGKLIAFDSGTDDETDVFVVTWNQGDPGEPEPLLTGPGSQEAPAWGTAP
jgi:Tol biopolymer transport system component